ncbi:MAG TPA: matrixin family metalloprotease [Polyangia bacterium]|nr:matrixin family metalloprotease [Polyangia bacterium]
MRHKRHQSIAVGLLAAVAAATASSRAEAFCRTTTCDTCPPPAVGCVTEGFPLFWPGGCVSYDLQKDASKWASLDVATTLVDGAFNTWGSVSCDGQPPSITFMNRGPIECAAREFNDGRKTEGGNANIIVFRDDVWPEVSDPASTLALTTVTYNRSNGQIVDADIEINGSQSPLSTDDAASASAFDLASILTHEVGHFLGLAHSTEPCAADGSDCPTMNALYRRGSTAYRTLEGDDQAGLCAIYPAGRTVTDNRCLPQGGFSALCGTPAPPSGGCALAGGGAGAGGRASWAVMGGAMVLASLVVRRRVRGAGGRRRSGTARTR